MTFTETLQLNRCRLSTSIYPLKYLAIVVARRPRVLPSASTKYHSFLWSILEGTKAEGIEIPEKPPDESGFMFLARLKAPRLWAEEDADGEA